MKYLKIAAFSIIGLILIIVVVGYLQPSTVSVRVEKIIKAPVCHVFEYVIDIEKRLEWSPVENLDTAVITTLGTETRGKGASYKWANETSGATGSVKYIDVSTNEFIVGELTFGDAGTAHEEFTFSEAPDGTKVTWAFRQEVGDNPFARILGIFIREGLRPVYNEGLRQLGKTVRSREEHPDPCDPQPQAEESKTDSLSIQ